MTPQRFSTSVIPKLPGIYAMYDDTGGVAYVGTSKDLRARIEQHLTRKDSSVTTGVSAVCLVPENVARVVWWTQSSFAEEGAREAAELIAFEILNLSLRSRGKPMDRARTKQAEASFRREIETLSRSAPAGEFRPLTLENLAALVVQLQERVAELEGKEA